MLFLFTNINCGSGMIGILYGNLENSGAGGSFNYKPAGGPSFNLIQIPGSLQFRQGIDDTGNIGSETVPATATVNNNFQIAETELTYELWYEVKTWAETDAGGGLRADGGTLYTFANDGREGSDGIDGAAPTTAKNEPVTMVNWRDSIVWCNALTEYYNAKNGTTLACVYNTDSGYSSPLRVSTNDPADLTAGSEDNPYANPEADGFRLPTTTEWGAAARWEGRSAKSNDAYEYPVSSDNWWTSGDYVSGDVSDYTVNPDPYAWTEFMIGTQPVKGKLPNALGIYDMSGNVAEWNFFLDPPTNSLRAYRGGSFIITGSGLQLGNWYFDGSKNYYNDVGFRFCRTSQ